MPFTTTRWHLFARRLVSAPMVFSLQRAISFISPQAGSATPDLSSSPTSSVSQAINLLYGTSIGKALLQVTCDPDPTATHTSKDAEPSWKAEVVFTNASYQAKRFVFLLFINRKHASISKFDCGALRVARKTVLLSPRG